MAPSGLESISPLHFHGLAPPSGLQREHFPPPLPWLSTSVRALYRRRHNYSVGSSNVVRIHVTFKQFLPTVVKRKLYQFSAVSPTYRFVDSFMRRRRRGLRHGDRPRARARPAAWGGGASPPQPHTGCFDKTETKRTLFTNSKPWLPHSKPMHGEPRITHHRGG